MSGLRRICAGLLHPPGFTVDVSAGLLPTPGFTMEVSAGAVAVRVLAIRPHPGR